MPTSKTNSISTQALIKKINRSAEIATNLNVKVVERQNTGIPVLRLTHAEIVYCSSVLPEIHPKLSLRGKAFIGGVIAREFTETERSFTVGKRTPARGMRSFSAKKTFEPKNQNTSKPLEVALESLNNTIYGRSADNETTELNEDDVFHYVDKVAAETNKITAELSEMSDRYVNFLNTEPVKYVPHSERREY